MWHQRCHPGRRHPRGGELHGTVPQQLLTLGGAGLDVPECGQGGVPGLHHGQCLIRWGGGGRAGSTSVAVPGLCYGQCLISVGRGGQHLGWLAGVVPECGQAKGACLGYTAGSVLLGGGWGGGHTGGSAAG